MLLVALAHADPCAGLSPCTVVETLPGASGKVVHVVQSATAERLDAGRSEPCVTHRFVWQPTTGPERVVLTVCNDGYGASGIGEDVVRLTGDRFTHTQVGGSAWRWSNERVIDLSGPRLVSEGSSSSHFTTGTEIAWSWDGFAGTSETSFEVCGSEAPGSVRSRLIPAVSAIGGWDWKTQGLGPCSVAIDSRDGPIVHGTPGEANDARLSAVVVGDALYIEVRDDRWVKAAKSWVIADHVEIWVRTEAIEGCVAKHPALQWGVSLDGAVHAAWGEPQPIVAQVADHAGVVRIRVTGLPAHDGITVVYSDSDDGVAQERLIATSPLRFGHGESLGSTIPIPPDSAVCAVVGGALAVKATRAFPLDRPLLPSAD